MFFFILFFYSVLFYFCFLALASICYQMRLTRQVRNTRANESHLTLLLPSLRIAPRWHLHQLFIGHLQRQYQSGLSLYYPEIIAMLMTTIQTPAF